MPASIERPARAATRELSLAARPAALSAAREFAQAAATTFGLDTKSCREFVFAANEAVTNAIQHGAPDEHGQIHLGIDAQADRLTFVVHDCGTFAPLVRASSSVSKPRRGSEHGRGLAMMVRLMDEVQLCSESGGTTVRLSKARAPA